MSQCVCSTYSSAMRDYAVRSALPTFAPGDVVRLKSGGPRMTIEKKWPNQESYEARWWNYTDRSYGSAYFKPETLVRAKGLDNE